MGNDHPLIDVCRSVATGPLGELDPPDPPDPPHAARATTTMRNFVRRPSRRFTSIAPFLRNSRCNKASDGHRLLLGKITIEPCF